MYSPDVVSLKQFYVSPVGQMTAILLWHRMRQFWPDMKNENVLALGYPVPFFPPQSRDDVLVAAGMTESMGALYWPVQGDNRVTLLDESALPFADASFNRVFMVHMLEHSNMLKPLMQEIWRVLTPGGRVMALVPNRMGRWARTPNNPFGHGRPFSLGQMRSVFAEGGLTMLYYDSALYIPGIKWWGMKRFAPYWEEACHFLLPNLGGVLLVEAEKQIYASRKEKVRGRSKQAMQPMPGVTQPAFSSLFSRPIHHFDPNREN